MAASTEPKLPKVPGESTTKPSFALPQIQTAPDVGMSQKVAGIAPVPNQTQTPGASLGISQSTPGQTATPGQPAQNTSAPPTKSPKAPAAPKQSGAETTNQGTTSPGAPAPLPTQPTIPTSTGAPPGVPNTGAVPVMGNPPVLTPPKALEGHNAAQNELITAENQQNQELYEAALKFNGGPDSALQQDQQKAESGLRASTNNRGAAGTIESSLYQGDKGLISTGLASENLKAYNVYQEETNKANELMQKAEVAYQRANEGERREIAEAAERREIKEAAAKSVATAAPPTTVPAGTAIPGVPNPAPHGAPPHPGYIWTPSGGGGWVPPNTKVVRTY